MARHQPPPLVGGGHLVSLLLDGATPGVPAVRAELDEWVAAPPIAHTAVIEDAGPAGSLTAFYGVGKDHYLLYELHTMRLVADYEYDLPSALATLDRLLAP